MSAPGLRLYAAPATQPLTAAQVKSRLRVTTTDEDTDLAAMLASACELCQAECGRVFVTQTWVLTLDQFPLGYLSGHDARYVGPAIRLPLPPLVSVTHVKYYDADGAQQTVSSADYWVAAGGDPGRIVPASGYWPATQLRRPGAVEVRFVCGYGDASLVPDAAKSAILVTLAAMRDDPAGAMGVPPAARRALDTLEYGEVR